MADIKEKLLRVLQIMQETDERSPINATQIVEILETKYELGKVNRHSVYQDIAVLERCGYSIRQCKDHRQGWYLQDHDFDDWEISLLMDVVSQTKCLTAEESKTLNEKLMKQTSERGRMRLRGMINALPVFKTKSAYPMGNYIDTMLEAMYIGRKIEFQYTELDDYLNMCLRKDGKYYSLSLYALYWGENTYYMLGMHDNHDDLTHYRLDRVRNLRLSEEEAIPAEERLGENALSQIKNKISTQVAHYGGEEIRIVLEYVPGRVPNAILFDLVGEDVRIRKIEEGRMRAVFCKQNSITLRGWLLQYAGMFEVVEPQELRNEIIRDLQNRIEWYNSEHR